MWLQDFFSLFFVTEFGFVESPSEWVKSNSEAFKGTAFG